MERGERRGERTYICCSSENLCPLEKETVCDNDNIDSIRTNQAIESEVKSGCNVMEKSHQPNSNRINHVITLTINRLRIKSVR